MGLLTNYLFGDNAQGVDDTLARLAAVSTPGGNLQQVIQSQSARDLANKQFASDQEMKVLQKQQLGMQINQSKMMLDAMQAIKEGRNPFANNPQGSQQPDMSAYDPKSSSQGLLGDVGGMNTGGSGITSGLLADNIPQPTSAAVRNVPNPPAQQSGQSQQSGPSASNPYNLSNAEQAMMFFRDPKEYATYMHPPMDPAVASQIALGIDPSQIKANLLGKGAVDATLQLKSGGMTIDQRTGQVSGYAPKLQDGVMPQFDQNGRVVGAGLLPGYAGAAQQLAGAEQLGKTNNSSMFVQDPSGRSVPVLGGDVLSQGANQLGLTGVQQTAGQPQAPQYSPQVLKYAQGLPPDQRAAFLQVVDADARGQKLQVQTGPQSQAPAPQQAPVAKPLLGGPSQYDVMAAKDLIPAHQARMQLAGQAPQVIHSLDMMGDLANKNSFGPGRSDMAQKEALLSIFPGLGSMNDNQTSMDLMKKMTANLSGQMSSGGTGTDARLNNAIASLPNTGMTSQAIQTIVPILKAQQQAILAEGRLRSNLPDNNPQTITQFNNSWNNSLDPRVFELKNMAPQQRQRFMQSLPPAEQQTLIAKTRALTSMGALQ